MKRRDLSIDVLKIIAMLAVVSEHMLLSTGKGCLPENVYWSIRVLCKINVNTFIIATAYLSIGRPTRLVNCLRISLSAIIVSVASYLVSIAVFHSPLSLKELTKCFCPILSNTYWFLTSYIGLYLLIPILNEMVALFQKKGCLGTVASMLYIVTSIYPQFYPVHANISNGGGRTLYWMVTLYFIAAAIKQKEFSKSTAILLAILSYLALYSSRLILNEQAMILFSNQSPLVLGLSLGIFILIRKMLYDRSSPRIVAFFAASTLSVYLIHECCLKAQLWQYVDDMSNISPMVLLITPVLIYFFGAVFHFFSNRLVNWICSFQCIVSNCEKVQNAMFANLNIN